MLLRFQKAAVRGNYGTGNQAFSMRLRFLTIRDEKSENSWKNVLIFCKSLKSRMTISSGEPGTNQRIVASGD
jgi:hypothetical protein